MAKAVKFASIEQPTITAVLAGLYRFVRKEDAEAKLKSLPKYFITASGKLAVASPQLCIWVQGYAVTDEEKAKGYVGNYAIVSLSRIGEKWTLLADKKEIPLKQHPQRRYIVSGAHPNWGHPLLRSIRKGSAFTSAEEAQAHLMKLHEAYPNVSIPGEGKLHLMVYGKPPALKKVEGRKQDIVPIDTGQVVQKYIFTAKAVPDGGVIIEWKLNIRKKKKLEAIVPVPKVEDKPAEGFFSTRENLRRKRKARR